MHVDERRSTARELDRLRSIVAAEVDILVGGAGVSVIDLPQGVTVYVSVEALRTALGRAPQLGLGTLRGFCIVPVRRVPYNFSL